MRLLVTGGMGFIGSNFIRYVLEKHKDWEIINLDKLGYGSNPANLRDVENDPRYTFVKGDIADFELMKGLVKQVDAVVNFAAESVAENEFVAVHRHGRVKLVTFGELFEQLSKTNRVIKDGKHEIIDVSGKNIKVLSFYNGCGAWFPLKKIIRHYYKGKLLCLRQKWGEICVTPNHSVYDVFGNLVNAGSNPELLAVRRINYYPHEHKFRNTAKIRAEGTGHLRVTLDKVYTGEKLEALLKLLAAYISEGNATYNKANGSYTVVINNSNEEWLKSLAEDYTLISNGSYSITKRKHGVYQLELNSKEFYQMCIRFCGKNASEKRLPDFVYGLDKKYQMLFWETLLEGDGTYRRWKRDKTAEYTTVSRRLAAGLGLLLALMGVDYTYHISKPRNGNHTSYTIRTRLFYNVSAGKREIIEIEYEGYVYDLEVEKSHNFIAGVGNIVAHNTHVDRSISSPDHFLRSNVIGVYTILEAIRKENPEVRLVHISTDEVYGDIVRGSFREEDALMPSSPYSATKAAADTLVLGWTRTYGLNASITRCTNNYGPYQFPEKLIPKTIIRANMGLKVPIYGTGQNVRDWIYVEDHVRAVETVLLKGEPREVYNVSAGEEKTNLEVVKTILKLLGKDESLIEFVEDRPGHDLRYSLDSWKITRDLKWRPKVSFEEGIKLTVEWYLRNEDWWRPLVNEKVLHPTPWKLGW
ncbi:dTDP-glucose 4,6-dehydratase [Thermococcus prieurii]